MLSLFNVTDPAATNTPPPRAIEPFPALKSLPVPFLPSLPRAVFRWTVTSVSDSVPELKMAPPSAAAPAPSARPPVSVRF